ncbi:hypothetical protein H6P81_009096 [Aristolochia fimbriata]|uniref:Lachrymatory factor synthase n=1 Tax=Aristolochia fimbriata TaxID=158543 RepID=A0AAV7EN30_ARIFI|nr:hypothetical protein H6P81_009096 [Aristolochia fimbriata]
MASEGKWEGKASAKVPGVSADKVWAVLDDYGNVYKYLPSIEASSIVSGEPGKLGCVRLCDGNPHPPSTERTFTNEKLVAYDPASRTLAYEVVENNVGFKDFVATIKVLPEEDGSCTIEWSFKTAPMPGPNWSADTVMGYIGYSVNHMAAKIAEEAKP